MIHFSFYKIPGCRGGILSNTSLAADSPPATEYSKKNVGAMCKEIKAPEPHDFQWKKPVKEKEKRKKDVSWKWCNSEPLYLQMKTHYDVLNVDKDCSSKEIKASFIKLSKKYHPDKNKNADAHKRFVEVNEAYSVLGKPSTRHSYDMSLSCEKQVMHHGIRTGPRTSENFAYAYAKNLKRQQENSGPYLSRQKFTWILFCFGVMAFGSALQVKAIFKKKYLETQQIAAMYKEQKERNQQMSREEKIKEIEAALLRSKLQRERLRKQ